MSGRRGKASGIPAPLFYGLTGLLMLTNALAVAGLLMSPDIARLTSGQSEDLLSAYEDRITQLRIEVDRLYSRSYAQAGDLNLQLQELSQQQELLSEQHELVRALVTKAGELGIEAAALPSGADETLETSAAYLPATGNPDVDATARTLGAMMAESRAAMTAISHAATGKTENIVAEFRALGIAVDLPEGAAAGMGGPLLPPAGEDSASLDLVGDANSVMAALYRYQAAKGAIERAPVHMPIAGSYRQSSGFGNRRDPFTGGRAFHAGLDFAAATGTAVFSAGEGKVTFAGRQAGYGNLVEITHGSGLVTRYAHLSAILVDKGQEVVAGTPIARVGSTGRSTGPHLHFEVRRDDAPLNPKAFLESGKRLSQLL
ncbi:M23 family metallopeptidase [Devosia geojensis]|uniref:M23 family metallopeptidase n=1 Tax=Devosia geojensis TaxID=443610 RepID=UPI000699115F|nr:M23 family metallopeptidase [Devosia geojensis]